MICSAEAADIAGLAHICQRSFPNSTRWQGPRCLSRRWWRRVLVERAAETWVCRVDGQVVGFCVLVIDEAVWAAQRRDREGGIATKLIAGAASPWTVLRRFWRERGRRVSLSPPAAGGQAVAPGERVWIELIAVAPHMRGQRIASGLLAFAEERSRSLGRKALGLAVDGDNRAACVAYDRAGFVRTSAERSRCTYTKVLAPASAVVADGTLSGGWSGVA